MNASPQRRDAFYALQTELAKLAPIQDVKTRWNSTFLMLRRAKRLRPYFTPFCDEYERSDLTLDDDEWRQIEYLLWITQPFFEFTLELSKTKDATTHHVFKIYNKLFEHLEQSVTQLRRKRVPWKTNMLQALKAAQQKLKDYYAETDDIRGDLYAIGTMLAPTNKLRSFQTDEWEEQWAQRYRCSFQDYLIPYKTRLGSTQTSLPSQSSKRSGSRLDIMLGSQQPDNLSRDELSQYLESGMYKV